MLLAPENPHAGPEGPCAGFPREKKGLELLLLWDFLVPTGFNLCSTLLRLEVQECQSDT